jgi:pilus assembly protein Flp/PilA
MAAIAAVAQALRNAWVLTRLRGSVLAFRTHVQSRVGSTRWEVTVKNLITRMGTLMRDDSGQDLLEYGLLAALIALVAIVAVTNSGNAVNSLFSTIATQVQNAANAAGA